MSAALSPTTAATAKAKAEAKARAKAEAKKLAAIEKKLQDVFGLLLASTGSKGAVIGEQDFILAMQKAKAPRKFLLDNPEMHGMLQYRDWKDDWEEWRMSQDGDNLVVSASVLLSFWAPKISPYFGKSRKEMGMLRRTERKEREKKRKTLGVASTQRKADKYRAMFDDSAEGEQAAGASSRTVSLLSPPSSPSPSTTTERVVFRQSHSKGDDRSAGAFAITTVKVGGEDLGSEGECAQARRRRTEMHDGKSPIAFERL